MWQTIQAMAHFKGNISAFDYFLDTDLDTIPDYFDLDSDEDGCYDVIEAGFEDADGDGIFGVGGTNLSW